MTAEPLMIIHISVKHCLALPGAYHILVAEPKATGLHGGWHATVQLQPPLGLFSALFSAVESGLHPTSQEDTGKLGGMAPSS